MFSSFISGITNGLFCCTIFSPAIALGLKAVICENAPRGLIACLGVAVGDLLMLGFAYFGQRGLLLHLYFIEPALQLCCCYFVFKTVFKMNADFYRNQKGVFDRSFTPVTLRDAWSSFSFPFYISLLNPFCQGSYKMLYFQAFPENKVLYLLGSITAYTLMIFILGYITKFFLGEIIPGLFYYWGLVPRPNWMRTPEEIQSGDNATMMSDTSFHSEKWRITGFRNFSIHMAAALTMCSFFSPILTLNWYDSFHYPRDITGRLTNVTFIQQKHKKDRNKLRRDKRVMIQRYFPVNKYNVKLQFHLFELRDTKDMELYGEAANAAVQKFHNFWANRRFNHLRKNYIARTDQAIWDIRRDEVLDYAPYLSELTRAAAAVDETDPRLIPNQDLYAKLHSAAVAWSAADRAWNAELPNNVMGLKPDSLKYIGPASALKGEMNMSLRKQYMGDILPKGEDHPNILVNASRLHEAGKGRPRMPYFTPRHTKDGFHHELPYSEYDHAEKEAWHYRKLANGLGNISDRWLHSGMNNAETGAESEKLTKFQKVLPTESWYGSETKTRNAYNPTPSDEEIKARPYRSEDPEFLAQQLQKFGIKK